MEQINCNMCKTFAKQYFNNTISATVKDYVLLHLLTCRDCLVQYKIKAKEFGIEFDLMYEACEFVNSKQAKFKHKTRDKLIQMGFQKEIEGFSHKWTRIAEKFELDKLSQLKCFSDLTQEDFTTSTDTIEEDTEAINLFARYMAKKFAKDVDLLEKCYSITGEEDTEDEKIK